MNVALKILAYALLVITTAACSMDAESIGDNNVTSPPVPGKPTVPIKRRPIVPTTKLPRPRIIGGVEWSNGTTLAIHLNEAMPSAEVVIEDMLMGTWESYTLSGTTLEVIPPHESSFKVTILLGAESYSYIVE